MRRILLFALTLSTSVLVAGVCKRRRTMFTGSTIASRRQPWDPRQVSITMPTRWMRWCRSFGGWGGGCGWGGGWGWGGGFCRSYAFAPRFYTGYYAKL